LAARFDQGRRQGTRLIGAPGDAPIDSSLDLLSLDIAVERLGEVTHQMIPVRDLLRGWSALPRSVSVETTADPG
jgi:hypothetical protein